MNVLQSDWQTDAQDRLMHQLGDPRQGWVSPWARPLLWSCALAVILFIVWAAWAEVDETTRGEGRVVPVSRIQKIQSLEGGLLEQMLVREGDVVEAGEPLLRLDPTRFRSEASETRAQADALRATVARLDAETRGLSEIGFPSSLSGQKALMASERALFTARRARLAGTQQALRAEIAIARSQLKVLEPLVRARAAPEMEALRLSQSIASLEGKLAEQGANYEQEANTQLAKARGDLAAVENQLALRQDRLQRTVIVSPVRGLVNDIRITTRGGVVPPGEPIMNISPLEEQLLIETKVTPRDVAFIAPGMSARVKITAYDYTVYGYLNGQVEQISPDTIEEDTPRGKVFYYKLLVRTDASELKRNGAVLPIKPGMLAEVDIRGQQRSILNYFLRPLIKAQLH